MNEYFTLHGLSCNKSLREKIDRAFRPLHNPSPERYAEITHNHKGNCPLLLDNGYCELHAKCTEEVLPSVCRYYPRGPKFDYAFESSCTNSCEKTLELLFEEEVPISFEKKELTFKLNKTSNSVSNDDRALYHTLRETCFRILSDRTHKLTDRIMMIGKLLSQLDKDKSLPITSIDFSIPLFEININQSLIALINASEWFIENSPSISLLCMEAKQYYSIGELESQYKLALSHFESAFPTHEIMFEKMLVNSLFFRQFPFQDFSANFYEEFISLCGMYAFTRYLSLPIMFGKHQLESFIDLMSKAYRVISHTRFERTILALLKSEEIREYDSLGVFIQL